MVFGIDAADDFDAGDEVEASIEPAAVRYGVDVAADEKGLIGFAVEGEPEVSGCIEVGFDGEFGHFGFQPIARGLPNGGERDALGTIVIAGEGAEFLQIHDRAFWVERGMAIGFHRLALCRLHARWDEM